MSTFTEHYNLIMPSQEDYYDVQDFNENTETLDSLLYEQETAIANVGEKVDGVADKIGTPEDQGTDTLFGIMKKSSGRKVYHPSSNLQYSIPQTNIVTSDSVTSGTIKITAFTAKHNGSIRIAYSTSGDNDSTSPCYFYILDKFNYTTGPDLSSLSIPAWDEDMSLYLKQNIGNGTGSLSEVIPVIEGTSYAFILYYYRQKNFTLNYFRIYYDEVDA